MAYSENLFSYGTLRYERVQMETFGRKLDGKEDVLTGYILKKLEITDPSVIAKSGENVHSIIEFSGNPQDRIPGMVFQISPEELAHADEYEVADYKRIQVALLSGTTAWVYVNKSSQ
ncbi:MAG TPA: gamma-glutamylcyclotransferase family protein [Rhabdochlamydiaceae bacterium]|nr:gamma-glutamylcyclotransferase family protein [Rhabdochlamydiaceae bacterium]